MNALNRPTSIDMADAKARPAAAAASKYAIETIRTGDSHIVVPPEFNASLLWISLSEYTSVPIRARVEGRVTDTKRLIAHMSAP
jgi:hypothetical protein